MPEPSPALIDTIARAIRLELHGDNDSLDLLPAPLAAAAIARYQRAARAALAAMPKPIGYVGAWHEDNGWTLDTEPGEYLRPTAAQALKDCSDYHYPIAAVVAVVPVEAPDAEETPDA